MRAVVLHGLQHVRQWDLDAEVDHAVAVIGQDDINQVLADVVHVAFDRGEDDGAFLLALDPLHHRFQVGNGGFHRLGALQHERQLHLAGAEQVADNFHAVQQHVVDDVERRQGEQRLIEVRGQAFAVAIDDTILQAALGGFGPLLLHRVAGFASGEQFHQLVQRVVALAAAIEDQVFGDLLFFLGDQMQRPDLRHVDDRAAHAGAAGVVEEHRVQHGSGGRVQPEADIGQPQDDLDIREFGANRRDALQRPLRELAVVLVAGGDGEGQRVDQQVRLCQAVPVAGEIHQPAGDAQFVFH